MLKKIKGEVKRVNWPDKKVLKKDLKIVWFGSIGLILAMSLIDVISKLVLNLIF